MKKVDNKLDSIILLIIFFILLIPAVTLDLMMLLEFHPYALMGIPLTAALAYVMKLIFKLGKGYKMKYYLNKKKFNSLYNESIKKFPNASIEFLKNFKNDSWEYYCSHGVLFPSVTLEESRWLYSSEDEKKGLEEILLFLLLSIKDETLLVGFCKKVIHLHDNMHHILDVILYSKMSNELKYLLLCLYNLTEYNLEDNELNPDYQKFVIETTEKVQKEFDPLIGEFKEEIANYLSLFKIKEKKNIKSLN